ncbi:LpqB family beta-propeller domain-containing protein [Actinotalea sp. M2MS4P-6]|uniref:LpqB family beta-propeller domain-containing protein n=1 Tax=Actinotalea sp. M2MS4P-6 TaxID=2983762 RepID=UPI0021E42A04|nr:LpqB family beta-propeller domain-containing protein [Actinotalea sp. M2MS4P-6]MCV2394144.1 LpqB family beta-propeller domain-containing protein [Actinotalea sp. M2MS4P-6]
MTRLRTVALALVLALLTGCATIPTSGPIGTGDVALTEPGRPIPLANDPPQDATIQGIVQGFLVAAAAGLADQFVVARKYLTVQASTAWAPDAGVVVYNARTQPEIAVNEDDGTAVVTIPLQGTLDENGVYTEAPPEVTQELALELTRTADNQWRISSLPDGVAMSTTDFDQFYRQMPLYFASADVTHLVPDLRWFPVNGAANYAVRALLAGPSAWLRDAVQTAAPEGTRLGAAGVVVADGVATVDLTSVAANASTEQRSVLLAQLGATLERAPGAAVSDVEVIAGGGEPWTTTPADLVRDPQPDTGPYLLAAGQLQVLEDGEIVPVDGVGRLPADASDPALSMDGTVVVALAGSSRLVSLTASGSDPATLLSGTDLVSPSVDRFDWTWTAETDAGTDLLAVSPDGERVAVTGDWLTGTSVRSIAVARDGSRIAVVHTGAGDQRVVIDVAVVLRDETGRPQRLGASIQVGASISDASQVEWVDESTLAVLGLSGSLVVPAVHLVPVGGQSSALPLVDGTRSVAAGRGDRSIYLSDDEGSLLWRQGTAWVPVVAGVQDPVFPG